MKIIDGKRYAQTILGSVKHQLQELSTAAHQPKLAVVVVGDNPASKTYVAKKRQACAAAGLLSQVHEFPTNVTTAQVARCLDELSQDESVHGILVQLPLPEHLCGLTLIQQICPLKDVDGLTAWNQGRLDLNLGGLFPCTPLGCMYLAQQYFDELAGVNATVIGNSPLVGSPMSRMLLAAGATVTTLHSQSRNKIEHTRAADLVVVATGHGHLVDHRWLKSDAVVLDVGISWAHGKMRGDVNREDLSQFEGYITPVPGGVGPMTIAMLLKNCMHAYQHLCLATPLAGPLESF